MKKILFSLLVLASTSFAFLTPTGGGGGGTPGGSTTNIQYNNAGAFGGFGAWDGTNLTFGTRASLNGDGSIGLGSVQSATSGVAVGSWDGTYGATASGNYSTAIGYDTTASSQGAIAVGGESSATNQYAMALAWGAAASGYQAFAGAYGAHATADYSVVLGPSATDGGHQQSVAVGKSATSLNTFSVSVGPATQAGGSSVSVGYGASSNASSSIAIGDHAIADDNQCIAIGQGSSCAGSGISIGTSATSTATNYNLAMGRNAYANSEYATVIGNNFNADNACSDSDAPNGVTLCGMNNAGSPVAENWLGIVPDASAANKPRLLFPAHAVSGDGDTVSAVQISGLLRLKPQGNGVTPTCGANQSGALAETSAWVLCVCNGSAWKSVAVLATTCTF